MKPCFGPKCLYCPLKCDYYHLHKEAIREGETAYEALLRNPEKYQGKLF